MWLIEMTGARTTEPKTWQRKKSFTHYLKEVKNIRGSLNFDLILLKLDRPVITPVR